MDLIVEHTERLSGETLSPPSKSHTIRAIVFAVLSRGASTVRRALMSEDTQSAIGCARALGAEVLVKEELDGTTTLLVESAGVPLDLKNGGIHAGNSGITANFFLPALGLRMDTSTPICVDAGEQLRARPVAPLLAALRELGLRIEHTEENGRLPISVSGALRGGRVVVDGAISQPLSALLMSLPLTREDSVITVRSMRERPYVEMTLALLARRGIAVSHTRSGADDMFEMQGGQSYTPVDTTVPGDFSSASYVIAAAALVPGTVAVRGLDMRDAQGDKKLVSIMREMGADITECEDGLVVKGGAPLSGIRIDCNDIPDMVPTLAVLGACALGETALFNAAHAREKETDRLRSMCDGLSRMGADITELADGLRVSGGALTGARVSGYGDHRTIMALAVAGLVASGTTVIDTAEGINKTFPTFVDCMNGIQAKMTTMAQYRSAVAIHA